MGATTSRLIERHIPCPDCPSTDAYCLYDDGHGFCFSCNKYFSNKGDNLTDDNGPEYSFEFLGRRGIAAETFRYFGCPTKIDPSGKPVSVGFHYPNGATKVRLLEHKDFRWLGKPEPGLFGKDKFSAGSNKYVTITEGEYDALSLFQVLRSPVVSVQSSVTGARDATVDRSWLNSFERIYLALDDDAPGRECAREIARLFDFNKIYMVKLGIKKDANAYLQEGLDEELRNVWKNSRKYVPVNVESSVEVFEKILTAPVDWGVPYPFRSLNDKTYGIRKGETVLVTAQEGVGKTEFMHALEYQLLTRTNSNVAAIYLEEPQRRHLQALAGIHLRKPAHLPDSGVTPDEIVTALKEVVPVDDRLFLYSHFGSDEPDTFLDTVRYLVTACQCDFVIVDHLTMVCSGLAGEDERRALDYIATRLEMMVKELNYALLIVSHVNDIGQTRGSRYISKVADIRIDLFRDLLADDPRQRNTTTVTVSKNRYCGRTGVSCSVCFDPLTNTYMENSDGGYINTEGQAPLVPDWPERQREELVI